MIDEWECPVVGCDFAVDVDDLSRETVEQHVRWVHLRTLDFGENPMEALVQYSFNGFLRPEEFVKATEAIMQREFDRLRPPMPRGLFAFTVATGIVVASVPLVAYALQLTRQVAFYWTLPLCLGGSAAFAIWWASEGRILRDERRRRNRVVVESGNNAATGSEDAHGERGSDDRPPGAEPGDEVSP